MKKMLLLVPFVVLILGCEGQIVQKFEPEPDIFALMKIDNDSPNVSYSQRIRVDRSWDIKDTVNVWGVRDALVRIIPGNSSYVFVDSFFDPDSNYWRKYTEGHYYALLHPKLNDTTLYKLEVSLPWGDTVTGETKMPSQISLSWPKDEDTLSIANELANPHLITWNNCLNVGLYTLQCVPNVDTSKYDSFPPFLFIPSFTIDTSYAFFQERAAIPWVYNREYVIRINAYGTEYANYVKFGLSGGKANLATQDGDTCYGVFSGIAIDSVRVFIIP